MSSSVSSSSSAESTSSTSSSSSSSESAPPKKLPWIYSVAVHTDDQKGNVKRQQYKMKPQTRIQDILDALNLDFQPIPIYFFSVGNHFGKPVNFIDDVELDLTQICGESGTVEMAFFSTTVQPQDSDEISIFPFAPFKNKLYQQTQYSLDSKLIDIAPEGCQDHMVLRYKQDMELDRFTDLEKTLKELDLTQDNMLLTFVPQRKPTRTSKSYGEVAQEEKEREENEKQEEETGKEEEGETEDKPEEPETTEAKE